MMLGSAGAEQALETITVAPDLVFSEQQLREALPTVEMALFFAKLYSLPADTVSHLLRKLFKTDLVDALTSGNHSVELQDYIAEIAPVGFTLENMTLDPEPIPDSEVLAQLFEMAQLEIAGSIREVADTLRHTVSAMPGKHAQMTFGSMLEFNRQRPTIGVHRTQITRQPHLPALVILDDSGSMTQDTIEKIVGDVVSLSYMADATLALVSNSCRVWQPGSFDVPSVLDEAEYMGTCYEELIPLFHQNWGTVVTIADYDSSYSVKDLFLRETRGSVEEVLDISLVGRPTYLAEVVGQIAHEVRPLLVSRNF